MVPDLSKFWTEGPAPRSNKNHWKKNGWSSLEKNTWDPGRLHHHQVGLHRPFLAVHQVGHLWLPDSSSHWMYLCSSYDRHKDLGCWRIKESDFKVCYTSAKSKCFLYVHIYIYIIYSASSKETFDGFWIILVLSTLIQYLNLELQRFHTFHRDVLVQIWDATCWGYHLWVVSAFQGGNMYCRKPSSSHPGHRTPPKCMAGSSRRNLNEKRKTMIHSITIVWNFSCFFQDPRLPEKNLDIG